MHTETISDSVCVCTGGSVAQWLFWPDLKSQLVCFLPVRICNHVNSTCIICFLVCFHWPWKAPLGEWSIKIFFLLYVFFLIFIAETRDIFHYKRRQLKSIHFYDTSIWTLQFKTLSSLTLWQSFFGRWKRFERVWIQLEAMIKVSQLPFELK